MFIIKDDKFIDFQLYFMIFIIILFFKTTYSWILMSNYSNLDVVDYTSTIILNNNNSFLIIFGGIQQNISNTLYIIDLNTFVITNLTTPLTPRYGCCSTSVNTDYFIFGGTDNINTFDQLWKFDFLTKKWSKIKIDFEYSLNRSYCSMSYLNQSLYIFGGLFKNDSIDLHIQIDLNNYSVFEINLKQKIGGYITNLLWDGSTETIFVSQEDQINLQNIMIEQIVFNLSLITSLAFDSQLIYLCTYEGDYLFNISNQLIRNATFTSRQFNLNFSSIVIGPYVFSIVIENFKPSFYFYNFILNVTQIIEITDIQTDTWPNNVKYSVLLNQNKDIILLSNQGGNFVIYKLYQNNCKTNNNSINCFYGKLYCNNNFTGAYCDKFLCQNSIIFTTYSLFKNFTYECQGNGICIDGNCVCQANFMNDNCTQYYRNNCLGTFIDSFPLGICECNSEIIGGNTCNVVFCYNDCLNIGKCLSSGICQCSSTFYKGPDCSFMNISMNLQESKYDLSILLLIMMMILN